MSIHTITRKDGGRSYKTRWREQGSNRSRSFDKLADARAFDAELRRRRQLGPLATQQLTERHGPTLKQWIVSRWAPEHGSHLAASTRERYSNVYAVHIAPTFDMTPISEITVSRLRAWQAERIKAGVQPGTIDKCRTLLSSILRHAAESEVIPANPMGLIRPPAAGQRDAVVPLAPTTVERIRAAMLTVPAPGTPQTRSRDALIVSVLAYSGLRPGELRALRWSDIGENVINVQRATDPDGTIKPVKTGQRRTVRLLAALAQDLREHRLVAGRPPENALIIFSATSTTTSWTKIDWQTWRRDRWGPACRAAGIEPTPRPYDCRHSFASLLLAEGRQPTYVARQLGHGVGVLHRTYNHLLDEFADGERIDAEGEVSAARKTVRSPSVPFQAAG